MLLAIIYVLSFYFTKTFLQLLNQIEHSLNFLRTDQLLYFVMY